MPKFEKGSPEAAKFMAELRAKRGTTTKENIKKLKENIYNKY